MNPNSYIQDKNGLNIVKCDISENCGQKMFQYNFIINYFVKKIVMNKFKFSLSDMSYQGLREIYNSQN